MILRLELTGGWGRVTNADDRMDQEGWTVTDRPGNVVKKTGRDIL